MFLFTWDDYNGEKDFEEIEKEKKRRQSHLLLYYCEPMLALWENMGFKLAVVLSIGAIYSLHFLYQLFYFETSIYQTLISDSSLCNCRFWYQVFPQWNGSPARTFFIPLLHTMYNQKKSWEHFLVWVMYWTIKLKK